MINHQLTFQDRGQYIPPPKTLLLRPAYCYSKQSSIFSHLPSKAMLQLSSLPRSLELWLQFFCDPFQLFSCHFCTFRLRSIPTFDTWIHLSVIMPWWLMSVSLRLCMVRLRELEESGLLLLHETFLAAKDRPILMCQRCRGRICNLRDAGVWMTKNAGGCKRSTPTQGGFSEKKSYQKIDWNVTVVWQVFANRWSMLSVIYVDGVSGKTDYLQSTALYQCVSQRRVQWFGKGKRCSSRMRRKVYLETALAAVGYYGTCRWRRQGGDKERRTLRTTCRCHIIWGIEDDDIGGSFQWRKSFLQRNQ